MKKFTLKKLRERKLKKESSFIDLEQELIKDGFQLIRTKDLYNDIVIEQYMDNNDDIIYVIINEQNDEVLAKFYSNYNLPEGEFNNIEVEDSEILAKILVNIIF